MKHTEIPTSGAYIVLVRSYNATARVIQFGMWLWQFFCLKVYPKKSINHADVVVDGWVIGAIARGVDVRSLEEAYGDGKKRELRVFLLTSLPEAEVAVRDYLQDHVDKPYEFRNFWHHAMRIFTGKWSGKIGDDANAEFYCIELAAGAMQIVYPSKVDKKWQINPVEFQRLCEDYLTEIK